jgi:hypothetical protein
MLVQLGKRAHKARGTTAQTQLPMTVYRATSCPSSRRDMHYLVSEDANVLERCKLSFDSADEIPERVYIGLKESSLIFLRRRLRCN